MSSEEGLLTARDHAYPVGIRAVGGGLREADTQPWGSPSRQQVPPSLPGPGRGFCSQCHLSLLASVPRL